ncbi:MAG: RAMP superfamily CRISPR-associated protein, partial [Ginsengibacter sp.]
MKLQITLQSFLLTGSGEGSALIDTDIVFDKDGFPFIPARRIKGMLKESMTEVMEMKGEPECKIEEDVIKFFGKEGDEKNSGRLLFKNYYLSEVSKENLPDLKKKHPFAFAPENIRKFFTAEIHQTALQDEVAKDTSLRNYRVIKPFIANGKAICFEGVINGNETLAENEKALLKEAVLNFRYAGTRRNRGFGKVSCRLDNSSSNDTNFSKAALGSNNAVIESGDASTLQVTNNEVFVQIKTLSPVVLAMQLGEKNTVLTEKVFNGNRLRGLLASQYIQARNLANAHSDPAFKELFLTCEVCFEPLFYNNAKPLPLHIHSYKSKNTKLTENEVNNEELVNIFNKPTEDEYEITKTVGGTFIRQQNTFTAQKPDTTFFFHNSRPNRSAGRSEEDQDTGGIFYYEALDEGQTFAGCIKGPAKFLNELIKEVSKQKTAQAGRSRSAQYGEVEITFTASPVSEAVEPDKNFTITHDIQPASEQQFLLTLQSPLLLLNKYGEPEANKNTLLHYVNTALNTSDITVENAAAAFTIVEQYNSVWKSKSGKLPAYKEGSAFLLN